MRVIRNAGCVGGKAASSQRSDSRGMLEAGEEGEIKKSFRSPNYFYLLNRHPKTSLPEVKMHYVDGRELLAEGGHPATCGESRQHFNGPSVSTFHAKRGSVPATNRWNYPSTAL